MSRKFKSLKKKNKQRYRVNNPRKGLLNTKLSMIKVKSSLNSKKIKEFYKNSNSSLSKNRIGTSGKFPANISPINGLKLYEDYHSQIKLIDYGVGIAFNQISIRNFILNTFINKVRDHRNDDDPRLKIMDAIPFFKLFKMYENFKNFGMDDLIGKFPEDKYFHLFKTELPLMKNIISAYSLPPRNDMEKYRVAILEPSDSKKSINTYAYFKLEKSRISGSLEGQIPIQIKILWIYSKNPHDAREIYLLMIHFYYIMNNKRLKDLFRYADQSPSLLTFDPEFYKQFKDSDMFKHIRDVFGYSMSDFDIDGKMVEQFIIPLQSNYILKDLSLGKDLTALPMGSGVHSPPVSRDLKTCINNLFGLEPQDYSIFLIKPGKEFYKHNPTVPLYKKVIKILNSIYLDENELFKDYLILIVNRTIRKNVSEEYFLEGFLTFRITSPKIAKLKCLHIDRDDSSHIARGFPYIQESISSFVIILLIILNNMGINICITDFINEHYLLLYFSREMNKTLKYVRSYYREHDKTGFVINYYFNLNNEYNYQFFFIKKIVDQNNYSNLINEMKKKIISKNRLRNIHNNVNIYNNVNEEWFYGAIEKKISMEKYNKIKNKNFNNINMKKGLELFLNLKKHGGVTYPFRYNIYVPDFYPRFESYEAYLNFEKRMSPESNLTLMEKKRLIRGLPIRPNF